MKVAFVGSEVKGKIPKKPRNALFGEALLKYGIKSVYYVPARDLGQTKILNHRDGSSYSMYIPCLNRFLDNLLEKVEKKKYFTTMAIQAIQSFICILKVLRRLHRDKIDAYIVLHLWDSTLPLFSFILSPFRPVALLYMGHSLQRFMQINKWFYYVMVSYYKVVFRPISVILINDDPEQKYNLFKILKLQGKKVRFFNPCIVDEKVFRTIDKQEAAKKVGFDIMTINILSLSRIVDPKHIDIYKDWNYEKNIFWVLEVFRWLVGKKTDVHLHIAGSGPGLEKLRTKINQYDLEDKVTLHGWIFPTSDESDLRRFLINAADLVVIPSPLIEFNIEQAIFEAFMCVKPVIAFKRYDWVPTEHLGGFLVDKDPKVATEQILSRLNPRYLKEKSREAKTVPLRHSVPMTAWGKRLSTILAEMLRGK